MTKEAQEFEVYWKAYLKAFSEYAQTGKFSRDLRTVIAAERADAAHAAVMAEREMRREVEDA